MPLNKDVFKEEASVQFLLKSGYELEADILTPHPKTGRFLFHKAVEENQMEVVKLLIEQKMDVNKRDNASERDRFRFPALFLAVSKNNEKMVRLLLEKKADPQQCEVESGIFPLVMGVIDWCSSEIVDLLLEAKADINQENMSPYSERAYEKGWSALVYATRLQKARLICLLIERGASLLNSQKKNALEGLGEFGVLYVKERSQPFFAGTEELKRCTMPYLPEALVRIVCSYSPWPVFPEDKVLWKPLFEGSQDRPRPPHKGPAVAAPPPDDMRKWPSLSKKHMPPVPSGRWAAPKEWATVLSKAPSGLSRHAPSKNGYFACAAQQQIGKKNRKNPLLLLVRKNFNKLNP